MNKGVRQVRKSITKRKKMRGMHANSSTVPTKQLISPFPQEEEKHGYFPSYPTDSIGRNQKSKQVSGFVLKGILSIILFFGVALLWETESDRFGGVKSWTSNVLTEDFPFAKVNKWYRDTFGSPLAFNSSQDLAGNQTEPLALPVNGSVTESFQANGKGIMIAPEKNEDVLALREGVVVFAGKHPETKNTVTIQHVDGSKSTYGHLSSIDVHLYQFTDTNQIIGKISPTAENQSVYFSIEKDNQYVDPIQVIKVDDK